MVMKRKMLKRTLHFTLALIFVMTAMLALLPADVAMATTVHKRGDLSFEADYDNYLSPGENFNFTLTLTNNDKEEKITIQSI